jgi:antitoxin (DNA-binding transcriptional repressor) of toxin-antitoxin stability system
MKTIGLGYIRGNTDRFVELVAEGEPIGITYKGNTIGTFTPCAAVPVPKPIKKQAKGKTGMYLEDDNTIAFYRNGVQVTQDELTDAERIAYGYAFVQPEYE